MHNHWLQNFSHSNVQAHFCLKCTNLDTISDEIRDLVHVKFNLSPPNNKEGPAELQSFFWVEWVFNVIDDLTDKFNRVHLTTRKHLQNISYSFGSNGFLNNTDGAQSVKLWVEEIWKKQHEENLVLIYETQGDYHAATKYEQRWERWLCARHNDFPNGDDAERVWHGEGGKHGCYSLNKWEWFSANMVHVVDESGEGVPATWLILNREDQAVLVEFFKAIRGGQVM